MKKQYQKQAQILKPNEFTIQNFMGDKSDPYFKKS